MTHNQTAGIGSFPSPFRGELPSDENPPRAGAETFQQLLPWHLGPTAAVGVVLVPHDYRGPPPPVDNLTNPETDDNYQMERRTIDYLCHILSSFQRSYLEKRVKHPNLSFPTIEEVKVAKSSTAKSYIYYYHAGTRWRSSYFIKVNQGEMKLIVHLANDGYLYMTPALLGEFKEVANNRHRQNAPNGWLIFENKTKKHPDGKREEFYGALNDFRLFAKAWFGTDNIKQTVLYNIVYRRIDICFQSKDVRPTIGLEFSFERDWDYPEDDPSWWDDCN